jgi:hypothetical protein
MSLKELRDRRDALEEEAELVKALIKQRSKQELSRRRIAAALGETWAQEGDANAS